MTPYPSIEPAPRARGRPRSIASHEAVLAAASQLLEESGMAGFSVDEVARRSGVSKATIYKHWRGGLDIAAEAFGARVTQAMPLPSSGDAVADLIEYARRVAAVYASPLGRIVAQLLAAAATSPQGAPELREAFFGERRRATAEVIHRAIEAGQLRDGIDHELIIDLLYGPIVFRIFNGGVPISPEDAATLARIALQGLAMPTEANRTSHNASRE